MVEKGGQLGKGPEEAPKTPESVGKAPAPLNEAASKRIEAMGDLRREAEARKQALESNELSNEQVMKGAAHFAESLLDSDIFANKNSADRFIKRIQSLAGNVFGADYEEQFKKAGVELPMKQNKNAGHCVLLMFLAVRQFFPNLGIKEISKGNHFKAEVLDGAITLLKTKSESEGDLAMAATLETLDISAAKEALTPEEKPDEEPEEDKEPEKADEETPVTEEEEPTDEEVAIKKPTGIRATFNNLAGSIADTLVKDAKKKESGPMDAVKTRIMPLILRFATMIGGKTWYLSKTKEQKKVLQENYGVIEKPGREILAFGTPTKVPPETAPSQNPDKQV